jgi:ElaB/YqjD/DUF883 family membrane-anchored ribosome-binding protein
MADTTLEQREKLMADLKLVVSDAEDLLKLTANEMGDSAVGLRERLRERITEAKHSLRDLQAAATEKAKAAGHAADDYVHEHPWKSVAIGAGIGVILGMLMSRR